MKPCLAPLVASVAALVLLGAGCSSRSVETGMSSRPTTMAVATPTTGAAKQPGAVVSHGHRPVRPIPEVIAKAKPFRMSPTSTAKALPRPARSIISSGVATASAVMPQPTPSHPTAGPDVAGINRMMRSYLQAFNRHDSAALAAHWSTTGENVDIDSGETTAGREAVREVFTALFEQDADATIDIDVASIRSLRDDVAVVDGV